LCHYPVTYLFNNFTKIIILIIKSPLNILNNHGVEMEVLGEYLFTMLLIPKSTDSMYLHSLFITQSLSITGLNLSNSLRNSCCSFVFRFTFLSLKANSKLLLASDIVGFDMFFVLVLCAFIQIDKEVGVLIQ